MMFVINKILFVVVCNSLLLFAVPIFSAQFLTIELCSMRKEREPLVLTGGNTECFLNTCQQQSIDAKNDAWINVNICKLKFAVLAAVGCCKQ